MRKFLVIAMASLLAMAPAMARTGASPPIRLVVNAAALTEQPPAIIALFTGEQFSVTVSTNLGYADITYQWYIGGTDLATTQTLTIPSATPADSGTYRCRVRSVSGGFDEYSTDCMLTVYGALGISQQPWPQSATAGDSVGFIITAIGGVPPLSYSWSKDGAPIDGATSASFSLSAITQADAGSYSCTVRDNGGNAVTSAPATLAVLPAQTPPPELILTHLAGENTFTLVFNAHSGSLASILSAPELLPQNSDYGNIKAVGIYFKLPSAPWTVLESHAIAVINSGDTVAVTFVGFGEDWSGNLTAVTINDLDFLGNMYFQLDNMGSQKMWLNPDVLSVYLNLNPVVKVLDSGNTMYQVHF